ncbi:hypothetical protein J6590_013793 [Homalodisca vitripennis]|nr:hypothetical protein J6590_013793 [Homalodisca vitripennis]
MVIFCLQVRYTGYRDRPLDERVLRFHNACREGHTEIAYVSGPQLIFKPARSPPGSWLGRRWITGGTESTCPKNKSFLRVSSILFVAKKNSVSADQFRPLALDVTQADS